MLKHSRRIAAALFGLATLAVPAAAYADAIYDTCMQAADGNADFGACGGAYMRRADAALNAAWKTAYTTTSGRTRADLLAEQRAWIVYKEKSCALYANGEQGREGQVIAYPACRAAVIEARTKDLRAIGKSLQGQ